MENDERLVAEFASLEPTYVDGLLTPLLNLGSNFVARYFRYVPTSANGTIIFERVPALVIVRPIASLAACLQCKVAGMGNPPGVEVPKITSELH